MLTKSGIEITHDFIGMILYSGISNNNSLKAC